MLYTYLLKLYLKHFLITLGALEFFYITIDISANINKIPDGANIMVLYLFYGACYALNYMLPVAIILSLVAFLYVLIVKNELIAIFSLGYSKKVLAKVYLLCALGVTVAYVLLNYTPFAYSKERLDAILEGNYIKDVRNGMFVKHENSYVYFGKLYPALKRAEDVKIFELKDGEIKKVISAKSANFSQNEWVLGRAHIYTKEDELRLGEKSDTQEIKEISVLEGFRPKVLDSMVSGSVNMSIIDAIDSIELLQKEGVDTERIRSTLYSILFFPFFAPLAGMILLYYSPVMARYQNISFITFMGILFALCAWGLFFGLSKLSISGLLMPEVGIVLPLVVLVFVSFGFYRRLIKG